MEHIRRLRRLSRPDPLPDAVGDLQKLAQQQAVEIQRLNNRLALFLRAQAVPTASTSTSAASTGNHTTAPFQQSHSGTLLQGTREILEDVERDTKCLNHSLASQLGQARYAKQALEQGIDVLARDTPSPAIPDTDDPAVLKETLAEFARQHRDQRDWIKKLRFELEMELGQVNLLRHENQRLRQLTVDLQASAEQEEEYIANTLLKRISDLKKEKGQLLQQVEQEEEYLTNTLQRKLEKLQQEKIDLENALEREQEFVVNKLQKQLDSLRMQQTPTREHSSASASTTSLSSPIGSPTMRHHRRPSHSEYLSAQQTVTEMLKAEVNGARIKISDMEKDLITLHQQACAYRRELIDLRRKLGQPVDELIADERLTMARYPSIARQRSVSGSGVMSRHEVGGLEVPRTRSVSSNSGSNIHHEPRFSQSVPNLGQPPAPRSGGLSAISKRKSIGTDARSTSSRGLS